jgi:tetratricopeptide (TPR) repeat protein
MSDRIRVLNKQALLDRIAKCRQILEANPDSQIFAALAEAYRKLGDLKSALDACNDGLGRHPDYGSAYLVLAKIARDQRRFDEAAKAVRRSIELEGATRSSELLLSDLYIQTGKFQAAEEVLVRLASADPHNQAVHRLLAIARKASRASSVAGIASANAHPALSDTAPQRVPTANTRNRADTTMPVAAPSRGQAPAAVDTAPRQAESDPWDLLFAALDRYPHLVGKLAVAYDGLLLATDIEIRSDAEAAAAMATQIYDAVRGEWPEAVFGTMEQLLVETEQTTWWLWPFAEFLLVLWCEPSLNMGPLRMRIAHVEGVTAQSTPGGKR